MTLRYWIQKARRSNSCGGGAAGGVEADFAPVISCGGVLDSEGSDIGRRKVPDAGQKASVLREICADDRNRAPFEQHRFT